MRYSVCTLLTSAGCAAALTQDCTGTSVNENNNWFCGAVGQILYQGLGGDGSFTAVTSMSDSGDCGTEEKSFSGALAPLDEDLSIHFRGPLQLKEFAVYYPGSDKKKRDPAPEPPVHDHARRHGQGHHHHQHLHKEKAKRADMVTATIDGVVVSWVNDYFGPSSADAPAAPAPTTTPAAAPPAATSAAPASSSSSSSGSGDSDGGSTGSTGGVAGDWSRVSYYNAEQQTADNVVFMGNYGGQGSGVWDTTWGNSLSYLDSEGTGGSATSQILKDTTVPSNTEFAIFSSDKCDDSCGYSRAEDVAYKGFSGANKVFLFNFQMPLDGSSGFNGDMPALWALNGRIPRTMQYGDCSCWTSGCGEADFFEVLASGDTKCKSTFHLANSAGSSDYFDRPVDAFKKAAVVFDEQSSSVSIKELDDSVDFADGLDEDTVKSWIANKDGGSGGSASAKAGGSLFSLFQVG